MERLFIKERAMQIYFVPLPAFWSFTSWTALWRPVTSASSKWHIPLKLTSIQTGSIDSCASSFSCVLRHPLRVISQPQDAVQAPVDSEKIEKDFCSRSCLSSFNYKRLSSAKLPLMPDTSQSPCSVCSRYCHVRNKGTNGQVLLKLLDENISVDSCLLSCLFFFLQSKYEVTQKNITHKMCSHPCFLRFCTIKQLSVCDNCSSTCKSPLQLKMEDGNKKLCSTECLNQFKQVNASSVKCKSE